MANPRDVQLDIVGNDKTGRATRSAEQNFERLKDSVEEVDGAVGRLGTRGPNAASRLGRSMVKAASVIRAAGILAIVTAIGAGLTLLPVLATAAGMGIVAGLGGGLAALGIAFAAKNKEVKKSFTDLKNHVVDKLTEMSDAFEPVLLSISDGLRDTFDSFAPDLEAAFDRLAPIVESFSQDFLDALEELKPAIEPVVDAFETLADTVGPKLPGLMESIANAFTDIADAIKDNPQAIEAVIEGIGTWIERIGKVIAWLIRMHARWVWLKAAVTEIGLGIGQVLLTIAAAAADAVASVLEAFARIPGPAQKSFQKAATAARNAAVDIQGKLSTINTRKLQAQVATGEARLKVLGQMKPTPKINAEIAQLKAQVAAAKLALSGIKDRTVNLRIKTIRSTTGPRQGGSDEIIRNSAVSFAHTSPGGSYRTGGPAPVFNTAVDTRVFIDGRELRAVSRSTVLDENRRAAWRARTGRR